MDRLDVKILTGLKKNGRASLSNLALDLKVTRATVGVRIKNLVKIGEIVGFTVLTKRDVTRNLVRGLMMLEIEGNAAQSVRQKLLTFPQIEMVHTTNGKWDLIVDLATDSLEDLDQTLFKIRKINGVKASETSLLLSSKKP
ncbi:MAG: Lrp/AsnC family transcriptional regulator [Proteobacteria bacterium]|jgi:DNA-binding Lrp family transcriptional regulator|nr:Lrp/AsnC family transcriptional regulator [Pseudomonadota bacterium]MDA1238863.1 Lrp/AsnC family transcriptional regulator [Pseudomonadota bacterium]